jgi:hypothetical protein
MIVTMLIATLLKNIPKIDEAIEPLLLVKMQTGTATRTPKEGLTGAEEVAWDPETETQEIHAITGIFEEPTLLAEAISKEETEEDQ